MQEAPDQGSGAKSVEWLEKLSPVGSISPITETELVDGIYKIGKHDKMTPLMRQQLIDLLRRYRSTFAVDLSELTTYEGPEGDFKLKLKPGETKCWTKPRRMNAFEMEAIDNTFPALAEAGFIRPVLGDPGHNNFSANIVVAMKKGPGGVYDSTRCCVDYSRLNRICEYEGSYRFETPVSLHDRVVGNAFYSCCDNKSAYHAIRVAEECQHMLAFWWPKNNSTTLWTWVRMPFGLASAPQAYSRRVVNALEAFNLSSSCCNYLDDTLVASKEWEAHLKDLENYFRCLDSINLKLHPGKSEFGLKTVTWLGFNCSAEGLTPAAGKVLAIQSLPQPQNLKALQSALGFFNYYRSFVKDYSMIAKPLTKLTKKNTPFTWGEEQKKAYQELKDKLCDPSNINHTPDPTLPFILYTDFSNVGIGCVLSQIGRDGVERVCSFASRSTNSAESQYSSYAGELLAITWSIKLHDFWLMGRKFTVVTDHAPLTSLLKDDNLRGKYARWRLMLQSYDFDIKHRPGTTNQNADVLSRMPLPRTTDTTGARLDDDEPKAALVASYINTSLDINPEPTQPKGLACLAWVMTELQAPESIEFWMSYDANLAVHGFRRSSRGVRHSQPTVASDSIPIDFESSPSFDDEDTCQIEPQGSSLVATESLYPYFRQQEKIQALAGSWIRRAYYTAVADQEHCVYPQLATVEASNEGMYRVLSLDAHPQPASAVLAIKWTGITLYEPFGGLCAGLEAFLRLGVPITRYIYSDISLSAQRVARRRMEQLTALYGPALFPPQAWAEAFSTLPQNIYDLDLDLLLRAGVQDGSQWVVVAGFECTDLSMAGLGRGLAGKHSSSYYPLLQLLGTLQRIQRLSPLWIVENVYMQEAHIRGRHNILQDFDQICQSIGPCCVFDAAQMGSHAHRLRSYWTNMAPIDQIKRVLSVVKRPVNANVNDILDPGRTAQICTAVHPPPYYPVNQIGQPIRCLPTLVAYMGSHAFRYSNEGVPGPGLVHDQTVSDYLCSLTIEERERALGYSAGITAAPGVSFTQRHRITGNCMDAYSMQSLLAIILGLQQRNGQHQLIQAPTVTPPRHEGGEESSVAVGSAFGCTNSWREARPSIVFRQNVAMISQAHEEEAALAPVERFEELGDQGEGDRRLWISDVWKDPLCLSYLQNGEFNEEQREAFNGKERQRAVRRSAAYQFVIDEATGEKTLYRIFHSTETTGQTRKKVPHPEEREELVLKTHQQCGHFGRRRTYHLLSLTHWWAGMDEAVRQCIRHCQACNQVNISFNATEPTLRPLPLMQLFYRWHVDLCSIGRTTPRGNLYCMVAIEAWSKYAVMIPIPDKTAQETSYAFLHHVLSRFGAPAEVVTDGGGEFMSHFDKMLQDALIDHRRTSSNHPQANGLAERCVRTLKHGLKKQVRLLGQADYDGFMYDDEDSKNPKPIIPWDLYVPWIALGYNASKQASTGFSPFYMIHARDATIPPAIRERFKEPLDFSNGNDIERLTDLLLERAKEARRVCLIAGDNLLIAQHRDTKRYAEIRSGVYLPKIRRFEVGDYVYVKRKADGILPTLETQARLEILRIIEIRPKGVLILQGKDLRTIAENRINCTPCHMPIVETEEHNQEPLYQHIPCNRCKQVDQPELMVVCSNCSQRFHIYCLQPPLAAVPKLKYWTCSPCRKKRSEEVLVDRTREEPPVKSDQTKAEKRIKAAEIELKEPTLDRLIVPKRGPGRPRKVPKEPKEPKETVLEKISEEEEVSEEFDLSTPLESLNAEQLEQLHCSLTGHRVLLQHVDQDSGIRVPELWTLEYKGKRHKPKCFLARHGDKKPMNLTIEQVQMTLVPLDYEPPSPVERDRSSGDPDELEIEAITAKRTTPGGRKTFYQVVYKGHPDNFKEPNNWVSEDQINQDALEEFERNERSRRRLASRVLTQLMAEEPQKKERNETDRPERARKESSRLRGYHVAFLSHDSQSEDLIADFDLTRPSGVLEALEALMPSLNGWAKGHSTKLANQLAGGHKFLQPQGSYTPGQPQRIATTDLEIEGLLDVIDFSLIPSIIDTFSGHGTIRRIFEQHGLRVLCNDIDNNVEADYHLDALQPSTYHTIKEDYGLDAVVISPTFAFLDLALPLAAHFAEQLVCCHVPGHYLTCAPKARFEWMGRLQQEGRLAIIAGLPVGPSHRRCLWFLIFRSPALKKLLFRPGYEQYLGFHFLTQTVHPIPRH